MISLKKTIEAFDYRAMWEAAFESYRSAIQSLEKNTINLEHGGLREYRMRLQSLKSRLETAEIRPEVLRSHALELGDELERYRVELESLLRDSGNDLKEVVAVLAEATESLSQRESLHGGQLSRISGSLEAIAQIEDPAQMRATLNRQVFELRTCIVQMSKDNESALASLQQEMAGFQKRLEKVQIEASTDPLTGVANRRRCTREIMNRVRARNQFGILLFDLNRFKQINDTHGHAAGDCVLQIVAQRLSGQVRKDDLVCRWGGDEFVVVHDGGSEELAARGRDIAKRISGKVAISAASVELEIGAEFGWAEYRDKETVEQLFARADKLLYNTKMPRLQIAAPVQERVDPATGLVKVDAAETATRNIQGDPTSWSLGCFVIRAATKVDNHYGFPATEEVLPFLRDTLRASKFGSTLFRGPGASILALVKHSARPEELEQEIRRISMIGLEKNLKRSRRTSILPIAVRGKLIPVSGGSVTREVEQFINMHSADYRKVAIGAR